MIHTITSTNHLEALQGIVDAAFPVMSRTVGIVYLGRGMRVTYGGVSIDGVVMGLRFVRSRYRNYPDHVMLKTEGVNRKTVLRRVTIKDNKVDIDAILIKFNELVGLHKAGLEDNKRRAERAVAQKARESKIAGILGILLCRVREIDGDYRVELDINKEQAYKIAEIIKEVEDGARD